MNENGILYNTNSLQRSMTDIWHLSSNEMTESRTKCPRCQGDYLCGHIDHVPALEMRERNMLSIGFDGVLL